MQYKLEAEMETAEKTTARVGRWGKRRRMSSPSTLVRCYRRRGQANGRLLQKKRLNTDIIFYAQKVRNKEWEVKSLS